MTPGQFGPMRRLLVPARKCLAFTMSVTGMPSVMQTTSGISAAAASMIASAAAGGGTKIRAQVAPSLATASATVFQTGKPSCVVPPLPGVTPPIDQRAVLFAPRGVEGAFTTGDALHDHARRPVDQNAHSVLPPLVGAPPLDEVGDFLVAGMIGRHRLDDDLIARVGVLAPAPPDHVLDEPIAVRALRVLLEERLAPSPSTSSRRRPRRPARRRADTRRSRRPGP